MSSISITTAPPIFPFDVADRSGKTGHIAYVTEIHVDLSYYTCNADICMHLRETERYRNTERETDRQPHRDRDRQRARERVFESKRV